MRYRRAMSRKRVRKPKTHVQARALRHAAPAEYASRLPIDRHLDAVEAVRALEEPEFRIVETLARLARTTPRSLAVRTALSAGLRRELERWWTSASEADPLAAVDRRLELREAAAASLWADATAELNRARLLDESVSSREAAAITNRSRQAIERQRRRGNLLALPVGREWRYPKWQFDLDSPRGVVPGLSAVIRNLHLSPFGTARWLTTPQSELDDRAPIELLHRRLTDRVVDLAEQHGHAV
jgi:hypothetical protein